MYKHSQGVEPGGLIELRNPACGHSVDMTLAIVDVIFSSAVLYMPTGCVPFLSAKESKVNFINYY